MALIGGIKGSRIQLSEKLSLGPSIGPGSPRSAMMMTDVPHDRCNWVIPGKLLMGAFPRDEDVKGIATCGVTHVVCLVDIDSCKTRGKVYEPRGEAYRKGLADAGLELVYQPIPSGGTIRDGKIMELVRSVCDGLRGGRRYYVHCEGGIGRAGTLSALVLGRMERLDGVTAIDRVVALREARPDKSRNFIPCPETQRQVNQVVRLLGNPKDLPVPDRSDMSWLERVKRERALRAGSPDEAKKQ